MEVLMSNWPKKIPNVPENYVFPPERRAGKLIFPACDGVPVINLEKSQGHDRNNVIQQILDACQKFGFFQVINHGVPEGLMDDTMNVIEKFFAMPAEYKAKFYSQEMDKKCRLYSSTLNYDIEEFHYWRDNIMHHCHPLQDMIQFWPDKPTSYRKVVGAYSVELRKFLFRILDLICEGLGIEQGHFDGELSKTQLLSVNYHIPCPDPSLTLGMPEHYDPNLITAVHQRAVPGLQVFRDSQWLVVEPVPNALVVLLGLQLKVMSNGKFSSPLHRVVPHSKEARVTISNFLTPSQDSLIELPRALVEEGHSPLYKTFTYREFFKAFTGKSGKAEIVLKHFKNKPE